MAIIYQTDKRSGITYAYEAEYFWDKEKQQSRSKKRLIGRVDTQSREIIPTDRRMKKAKESAHKSTRNVDRFRPSEEFLWCDISA